MKEAQHQKYPSSCRKAVPPQEAVPWWGRDHGPNALPKYLTHVYVQAPSRDQHARKHLCLPEESCIIPLRKAMSWTQMTGYKIFLSDTLRSVKCLKTCNDISGPRWSSPACILPG